MRTSTRTERERIEVWVDAWPMGFTSKQLARALDLDHIVVTRLLKQMVKKRTVHVACWDRPTQSAVRWEAMYLSGFGRNAPRPAGRDFRPTVLEMAESADDAGITTRGVADTLRCSVSLAGAYLQRMVSEGLLVDSGWGNAQSGTSRSRVYMLPHVKHARDQQRAEVAPPPPIPLSTWGNALRGLL